MCARKALYETKEKVLWMLCFRRLLKLGYARILVIPSGAQTSTELKSSNDTCKMLKFFGKNDDQGGKVLENSEEVLGNAASKRLTARNVITTNEDEGKFKCDFIMDCIKN